MRAHLGHANARVDDGDGVVGLVRDDVDEELGLAIEHCAFGKMKDGSEGRQEEQSAGGQ
jgi:hypothetical protein